MNLPEKYLLKMQDLLKDEYDSYLASFNNEEIHSLRINTKKISVEGFIKIFPYKLERIPWTSDGFYYDLNDPITKHPYYYAGLYYIQEASAMLPGEVLPIEENSLVLDACAAPGGKSLKLLNKLNNTGCLISNDISSSRSQTLMHNIINQGHERFYVTSLDIEEFENELFDSILLDAPCSGEGMFHKDPSLIKSWLEKDSEYYINIQKELILKAYHLLKKGGYLVYSTCTFDIRENEEVIKYLLDKHNDMKLINIENKDGFSRGLLGLEECVRLYPHKIKGEGHFVALLKKDGENIIDKSYSKQEYNEELKNIKHIFKDGYFSNRNDKLYFIPDTNIDFKHKRVLRSGLLIGEEKRKGFEYDYSFAKSLDINEYEYVCNLDIDDERVIKYLKGETININDYHLPDELILICVNSFPLGFGKNNKGILKNKLPFNSTYK